MNTLKSHGPMRIGRQGQGAMFLPQEAMCP